MGKLRSESNPQPREEEFPFCEENEIQLKHLAVDASFKRVISIGFDHENQLSVISSSVQKSKQVSKEEAALPMLIAEVKNWKEAVRRNQNTSEASDGNNRSTIDRGILSRSPLRWFYFAVATRESRSRALRAELSFPPNLQIRQ